MRIFFICLVLAMATCKKDQLKTEWSSNAAKWKSKDISNYLFTINKVCFCPQAYVGPFVVKVTDDKIISVNGAAYQPELTGELWTINGLFDFIKISLDKNPAKKTIQYNADYGYPELIFFDFDERVADEEIKLEIKMFQIVK